MPSDPIELPRPFLLLVVGRANVRRSALAERVGAAYLTHVMGMEHIREFRIVSAGTRAVAGEEMDEATALVLRGLGGDPARFWAQRLSQELAVDADLTLTMSREEREEVLILAPRALSRTFTLLEAVDLLRELGGEGAGEEFPARACGLVAAMAAGRAGRRSSDADDVPDPEGRPVKIHQDVGEAVAHAMLLVLSRLLGIPQHVGSPPRRAADRAGRARRPFGLRR